MQSLTDNVASYLLWANLIYQILLALGISATIISLLKKDFSPGNKQHSIVAILLSALFIYLLGKYPIPFGSYSDRDIYAGMVRSAMKYTSLSQVHDKDIGFGYLTYGLTRIFDLHQTFIIYATIYIGNYYWAAKRLVKGNSPWLLCGILLSFGFIAYGINTMRAGLAVSFIVVGLSYWNKLWKMCIFFAIAIGLHFSMTIPVTMIMISRYYKNTRLFFYLWLLAVPISFIAGDTFNTFFSTFSEDSRTEYLTAENDAYNIGFRIDFILYSLAPLAIGYYYIYKRKFKSTLYANIYNAYILTNIFWILVIRANFSDRFAYLSWFMIPLVLLIPILKDPSIVKSPRLWVASIILGNTLFRSLF